MALEREWETFLTEMPRLLQEGHRGKYVLIQGESVYGVWTTLDEALAAGYDRFGVEPFLAQEINDKPEPRYFSRNVTRRSSFKVYADFHNLDDSNRVRLSCAGTLADLSRQRIELREGLVLTLYMDDADDRGQADELLVEGVVHHCRNEQI